MAAINLGLGALHARRRRPPYEVPTADSRRQIPLVRSGMMVDGQPDCVPKTFYRVLLDPQESVWGLARRALCGENMLMNA